MDNPNSTTINSSVVDRYPWQRLLIGLIILLVIFVSSTAMGSVNIPIEMILRIIISKQPFFEINNNWPSSWEIIVWDLRIPRIVLAGMVGAALSLSGATYQGLFRNPLADPYLIGVASSASLGAIIALTTRVPENYGGISILPMAAFAGSLIAVTVAYLIAHGSNNHSLTTLILAGVAIAYFTGATGSLLMIRSETDLRPIVSWILGGFISAQWIHVAMMLPYILLSVFVVLVYGRILNILQLGEDHSRQLGVNVNKTKLVLIAASSLATAAAVAFSGPIGFVGLIAPHTVRLLWGVDYRTLLPMTMLVGAGFLVIADTVARTILSPIELPVGIVTAFCGAPFFLYLLRSRSRLSS